MDFKGLIKKHGSTFIKVSFYVTLLILYIQYYFMEQVLELLKARTQFSAKIEQVPSMPIPTLTLCFKPYFKKSQVEKYGYNSVYSLIQSQDSVENKWNVLNQLSYSINEDFVYEALLYLNNVEHFATLKPGLTKFPGGSVQMEGISTLRHGICYLMKANYNVSVETITYFGFKVTFKNLAPLDIPTEFEVYLTSPDGYYGLYFDDWAHFEPTHFTMPNEAATHDEWVSVLIPSVLQFKKGNDNIEQCLEHFLCSLNCSVKCFPLILNNIHGLQPCQTLKDQKCMFDQINEQRKRMINCLKPMETKQFR